MSGGPSLARYSWNIVSLVSIVAMLTQHGFTLKQISGRSMQPTLNPEPCIWKDLVLCNRFPIYTRDDLGIKRGDIVTLRSPVNPKEMVVKKVIALPGETVHTLPPYPVAEVKVPEGYIWVEGDEPFWTLDSNSWGPVPLALVDAKISYIIWPLNRFGPLKSTKVRDPSIPRIPSTSEPAWKRQIAEIHQEQWLNGRTRRK